MGLAGLGWIGLAAFSGKRGLRQLSRVGQVAGSPSPKFSSGVVDPAARVEGSLITKLGSYSSLPGEAGGTVCMNVFQVPGPPGSCE